MFFSCILRLNIKIINSLIEICYSHLLQNTFVLLLNTQSQSQSTTLTFQVLEYVAEMCHYYIVFSKYTYSGSIGKVFLLHTTGQNYSSAIAAFINEGVVYVSDSVFACAKLQTCF